MRGLPTYLSLSVRSCIYTIANLSAVSFMLSMLTKLCTIIKKKKKKDHNQTKTPEKKEKYIYKMCDLRWVYFLRFSVSYVMARGDILVCHVGGILVPADSTTFSQTSFSSTFRAHVIDVRPPTKTYWPVQLIVTVSCHWKIVLLITVITFELQQCDPSPICSYLLLNVFFLSG